MAKRENTFLLKRSNIPGKIPLPGDLNLGEVALNTADVILYASGTTANSILPIGWDRISRTGDTVNGNFIINGGLTANTISATTYLNLPIDVYVTGGTYSSGTATFTNNTGGTFSVSGFSNGVGISGDYLPLSGGTVTGGTIFKSGLTANTIYTDYIDFNTTASTTTQFGRVSWDSGTGTLNIGIGDSTTGLVDFQVGQEEVVRVFNAEATTLQKGEIVYVFSSQGNRPSVKRAQAQGDLYSVTTLGMVDLAITSGSEGYVTTFGIISNLNTLGLTGGTPIWLSPTTPGGYTSTKPQAPNHTVLIGYVVRVSATVGSIFVNISNGWELDELHDVRINGVSEGDLLMRSSYSGSSVWVNSKTLNGSYTITGNTSIGGNLTVTGNTRLTTLTASTIGASGNCVNDIYVSNIHSCSPLNINPLNEGNVYFGSISAVTVDLTNQQLGVGTTAPIAKLHISDTGVTVNPSLYTSDYVVVSAQDTAPGFNIISAGGSSGNRGVFKATRSRGTLSLPTIPSNNDNVFSLLGAIYDGVTNYSTAAINMDVDGVVTTGVTPQRIVFSTGTGSTRSERMRITSSGNVGIGLTPTVPLHVRSTAIPSTGENILQLEVGDSTGAYAAINNSTSTDGQFVPQFFGRQSSSSNQTATIFGGVIDSTQDSGTTPVTLFRSFLSSLSVVATRPVFQFRNWTTNLLTILSNGNLGIGTDTPTAKLHINNTTSGNTFLAEDSTSPDSSPFVIDNEGNVGIGKTSVTSGTLVDLEVGGKTIGINIGNSNTSFMAGTGIFSYGTGIGINGVGRNDFGTVVGIKGESTFDSSADPSAKYYGGEFISSGLGGGDYSVRLSDGTEGVGKFLYSVDANGSANWTSDLSGTSATISGALRATTISATTISATTYYGSGSNLTGINDYYVTGGTYSAGTITLDRQNGSVVVTGITTPNVQTITSASTVTAITSNDIVVITAQAGALLLANPTGVWSQGQPLMIRIKDNGTARAISYGNKFRAIGVTLPTTTTANKTTYLGTIYNSTDDKFDVIGVTTEA